MTGETVFVSRRRYTNRNVYHMDPKCGHLSNADDVRETTRGVLYEDMRQCRYCAGEYPQPGGSGNGHYQSLIQAADEDGGSA